MNPVSLRLAAEQDVPQIRAVFLEVYGATYPYRGFLDDDWLKRSIFDDNLLTVVAEEQETGRILGTASVVSTIGAQSDLLGEFGRLVVLPEAAGRGIGRALMDKRIELARERLHVALVENRTVHLFSQKISERAGFSPVGLLVGKHKFVERESMALYVRHFGDALVLRRNHPRLIPEVQPLAYLACEACGVAFDAIVDEQSAPYPVDQDYLLEELSSEGYAPLLRIERGRVRNREVFGPVGLHHGFFKLSAKKVNYLVARRQTLSGRAASVAGAVGFTRDEIEDSVRVVELIAPDDAAVPFLIQELLRWCRERWGVAYVEVDLSAHAPRLQRTLIELGFLAVAYVPAMVFAEVERLDVVKMARVLAPVDLGRVELVEQARDVAAPVLHDLQVQSVRPELERATERLGLFAGLNTEQVTRLASAFEVREYAAGEQLFRQGQSPAALYLVLQGRVSVLRGEPPREVGVVERDEVVGEHSLLTEEPRSASGLVIEPVTAAILSREQLTRLTRRRPDIAVVLYRNLSISLGRKLRRATPSQLPE